MFPNSLVILILILGLVVGSFLGNLTYRFPRRISVIWGRSKCPHCGHKIAWYDNIPVISYILLRGRCRNCKKEISKRYPLIEIATAVGFVGLVNVLPGLSFYKISPIWGGLFLFVLFSVLVAIFVIDLEHKIIPDELVFFAFASAVIFSIGLGITSFYKDLFAAFLAANFLLAIHLATGGRGMGLGDVKFALVGGFIFGLEMSVIWLLLAFLTGALVGIILILTKKASFGKQIPFGPYLAASLGVTLVFGDKLIKFLFP